MTLNEILNRINDRYPNGESASTKIEILNDCLNSLSDSFGLTVTDETLSTVADTDEYAFPDGIEDVSQIIHLSVGKRATPESRYDYTEYRYRHPEPDRPMGYYSFSQATDGSGAKSLVLYPIPREDGLPIRIDYRKRLTLFESTGLSAEPEIDSKFHQILVYYTISELAKMGSSPNAEQANMFQSKYDETLLEMRRFVYRNKARYPLHPKDNPQWHRA